EGRLVARCAGEALQELAIGKGVQVGPAGEPVDEPKGGLQSRAGHGSVSPGRPFLSLNNGGTQRSSASIFVSGRPTTWPPGQVALSGGDGRKLRAKLPRSGSRLGGRGRGLGRGRRRSRRPGPARCLPVVRQEVPELPGRPRPWKETRGPRPKTCGGKRGCSS